MKLLDVLQEKMDKFVSPVAQKLNSSNIIKSLTAGMMGTMSVTLGVAAIAVIGNLPIQPWLDFLASSGLQNTVNEVVQATLSLLAIYIVINVAYTYAKNSGEKGIYAGVIALAVFILMIPQYIKVNDDTTITAIQSNYLGSNGIFVSMIIGLIVGASYTKLLKKGIKLKFPDTVPPNVSDSLSPTFVAMIIFGCAFFVKWGLSLTTYGNIFDLINKTIAIPVMSLGATPLAYIIVFTFCNFMWFFGVHPTPIKSAFFPVMMTVSTANIEAFSKGEPLPYLACAVVYLCIYIGGQASTLGLSIDMLTAKSERFKSVRAVSLIPNIFNINEPIIFGVPTMLNPIFFIPMILASVIPGLIGMLAVHFITFPINPTISMPWVTPPILKSFLIGGWQTALLVLVCLLSLCLLYYPFFRIADKQALENEKKAEKC